MNYDPVDREDCFSVYFCCDKEECEDWDKCTVQAMSEAEQK